MMRHKRCNWHGLLALPGLLALASCARAPTLLVTVTMVPDGAQSLRVQADHDIQPSIGDPDPYDLTSPHAGSLTFLLRLPSGFSGSIEVAVAAFQSPGGSGCLLAGGSNKRDFLGPDEQMQVTLSPLSDTACSGKVPVLLSATPMLIKTTPSGQDIVDITGWGFKPGAVATFGAAKAMTTYVSPLELKAVAPPMAGFGPTPLKITNPDGAQAVRSDLIRYYADKLDFSLMQLGIPMSIVVGGALFADLDNDGSTDAAVALRDTGKLQVFLTDGNRNIKNFHTFSTGMSPSALVGADLNNDKFLDLAVANSVDNTVTVFINDGTGNYKPLTSPLMTDMDPEALAAADLDGDGLVDLATANTKANSVTILLNGKDLVFAPPTNIALMMGPMMTAPVPVALAAGDVNHDGLPDLAVSENALATVLVMLNKGGGKFSSTVTAFPLQTDKNPQGVQITDINGDGLQDLLVANAGGNSVTVYINQGGVKVKGTVYPTSMQPRMTALGDLNGDGLLDIAVPCTLSNSVDFLLNLGSDPSGVPTFGPSQSFSIAPLLSQPSIIAIVEADNDNKLDVGVVGSLGAGVMFNQSK